MAQPECHTETSASRRDHFWWHLVTATGITIEKNLHGTVGLQPVAKDGACKTCELCMFTNKVPFYQKATCLIWCNTESFPCPTEKTPQGIFNKDTFASLSWQLMTPFSSTCVSGKEGCYSGRQEALHKHKVSRENHTGWHIPAA